MIVFLDSCHIEFFRKVSFLKNYEFRALPFDHDVNLSWIRQSLTSETFEDNFRCTYCRMNEAYLFVWQNG